MALQWKQMVNSQGWAYQMKEEGSQAEKLPLARGKNRNATTLLQEGSLLTLAAVIGNLNMPEISSCSHYTSIQSYDVINRLF